MCIYDKIKGAIDTLSVLIGTETEAVGNINTKAIVVCGFGGKKY
jgi:hypothetical protein